LSGTVWNSNLSQQRNWRNRGDRSLIPDISPRYYSYTNCFSNSYQFLWYWGEWIFRHRATGFFFISQRSGFFRFQEKSHHIRLEESKPVVISDGKIDITDRSIGIIWYYRYTLWQINLLTLKITNF
jgi:hypothetical protein